MAKREVRPIRIKDLCTLLGTSRATIWRWAKTDPEFPKPFHLSAGVTCWDEAEILRWVGSKKTMRDRH